MSYRDDIMDELHALKREVGHVLKTSAEEWQRIAPESPYAGG